MTERSGIEIDYCPKCRGVWLDRGELDKIIERAAAAAPAALQPAADDPGETYRPAAHRGSPQQPYGGHHKHPHKKRKSFLSDIFDFD